MTKPLSYDPNSLSEHDRYKLLISLVIPRPIALVTTLGPTGVVNAAPFSFFNMFSESPPLAQAIEIAEEGQPARRVGVGEPGQEEPPEQAREHPHRQQEAGPARYPACPLERDPAARHNHVNVRMMGHCRTPGMEYRGGANAGTQMPGIGCYGEQRLGGCAE